MPPSLPRKGLLSNQKLSNRIDNNQQSTYPTPMRTNTLTTLSDPERLRYSLQSMLEHVTGPLRDRLEARLAEVERQLRQRKGTQRVDRDSPTTDRNRGRDLPLRRSPHAVPKTHRPHQAGSRWERAFPGQAEAAKGVRRRHARAGARSASPEGLRSQRRPTQPVQPRRSSERRGAGGDGEGLRERSVRVPSTTYKELLACKRCSWATESETRYACPKGHILECHQARPTEKGWEVK